MSDFEHRDYQVIGVNNLRSALAEKYLRLILSSPTGSGKTEMGMMVIRGAVQKKKRVAFLCNRINLVEQTSKRFRRANIPHGIIQGENTARTYENVLVASIQTVARRGMPDVDLLVIDEAHGVSGSKDFRKLIMEAKDVPVIGLSATPYAKGMAKFYAELGGPLFQKMIVAATVPELIELGYLVDVDVYAPSTPDMKGIKQSRNAFGDMDYSDADVGRAVDKPELIGDIVKHWFRLAKDTPTVCFAANIAHSKHIVERFLAAGVEAEHIDCYTDEHERQAILKRVESGETKVVSNVGILCEGWDFPACKTLILARPTRSLIRYLQMAGRIFRPHETKDRGLILDHSGTCQKLGFPTDDFTRELDDGTPKKESGKKEAEEKLPKPCPSCSFLKLSHKCPQCGFAPQAQSTIVTGEGNLELQVKSGVKHLDKQTAYSQLLTRAEERGYSRGWVSNQYRELFGVWPVKMKHKPTPVSFEMNNWLKHKAIKFAKKREKEAVNAAA